MIVGRNRLTATVCLLVVLLVMACSPSGEHPAAPTTVVPDPVPVPIPLLSSGHVHHDPRNPYPGHTLFGGIEHFAVGAVFQNPYSADESHFIHGFTMSGGEVLFIVGSDGRWGLYGAERSWGHVYYQAEGDVPGFHTEKYELNSVVPWVVDCGFSFIVNGHALEDDEGDGVFCVRPEAPAGDVALYIGDSLSMRAGAQQARHVSRHSTWKTSRGSRGPN